MSVSSGWICSNCQQQLRLALLRPARSPAPRRTFVSLGEIANKEKQGDLEDSTEDAEWRYSSSRKQRDQGKPEPKSDVFLEKLFKSTGRKPPSSPFRLRYSQRLLQVGEQDQKQQNRHPIHESGLFGAQTNPDDIPKWKWKRLEGRMRREMADDARDNLNTQVAADGTTSYSKALDEILSDPFQSSTSRRSVLEKLDTLKGQESLPPFEESQAEESNHDITPIEDEAHASQDSLQKQVLYLKTRLRGAKNAQDMRQVGSLWRRFQFRIQESNDVTHEEISDMLTEIMSAFVEFNSYKLASQVWTTIQNLGVTPTLKQWTIMLELARKSNDIVSLRIIWQSMLSAEVLPDNVAWTSYISSLGRKNLNLMLEQLSALERQWHDVTSKEKNLLKHVDKSDRWRYIPSIYPFNAALACLIHKKREDVLRQILLRIDSLKLTPNVDTFNTLLRRATVPGRDKSEVEAVLQQMKAHNIEPDKITVSTLLDANLRDIGANEDPELIESSVKEIFAELDTHGVKPEPHTYTTALNVLLACEKPNVAAARAVMKHMSGYGIEPSPHVYTILIGHYFRSEPPNRSAVSTLFLRAQKREIKVDSFFFDRLIEGYATLGDSDRILECIRHMQKVGKAPGWIALRRGLQILSELEYWENCEEIIRDVENQAGIGAQGIRTQAAGQPDFWNLVHDLRSRGVVSSDTSKTSGV